METQKDIEEIELKTLDHALRHILHENEDHGTARPSAKVNAAIDLMQTKERKRKIWRFIYPAAAAVALLAVILTNRMTYSPIIYSNNSEASINIGLPDGTQVWINPGTELSFDNTFNKKERKVKLAGEAYFDVAHNQECPFIVSTDNFRIKVLGTVFNVKAYKEDRFAEVSLAQGKVSMQNTDGMDLVRLRPGQQAIFDVQDPSIEIKDVQVGDMLKRHYGAVSLHNATISEILKEIYTVYGVEITASDPDDKATYNFSFQEKSEIEDVLDILRFTCKKQAFVVRR